MPKFSLLTTASLLISSSLGAVFQGRPGANDTITLGTTGGDTWFFNVETVDEKNNVDTLLNYDVSDIIRIYNSPPAMTSLKCFQDGRVLMDGKQIAIVKPNPTHVTFACPDQNSLDLETKTMSCEAVPTPCELKPIVNYKDTEINCGVNKTNAEDGECNGLRIIGDNIKKLGCQGNKACEDSCITVNSTSKSLELMFSDRGFNGGQLVADGVKKIACGEESCKTATFNAKCDESSGCEYMCEGTLSCPYGITKIDHAKVISCKGKQSCQNRIFDIGSSMSDMMFEGDKAAENVKIVGMSAAKKISCKSVDTCREMSLEFELDENVAIMMECSNVASCQGVQMNFAKKPGFAGDVTIQLDIKCQVNSCTNFQITSKDIPLVKSNINCDNSKGQCDAVFINTVAYPNLAAFQGTTIMSGQCKTWNISTIGALSASGGVNIILIIVLIAVIKKNLDVAKIVREKDVASIVGAQKPDENATVTEQI